MDYTIVVMPNDGEKDLQRGSNRSAQKLNTVRASFSSHPEGHVSMVIVS
jgi:hypothetical protein